MNFNKSVKIPFILVTRQWVSEPVSQLVSIIISCIGSVSEKASRYIFIHYQLPFIMLTSSIIFLILSSVILFKVQYLQCLVLQFLADHVINRRIIYKRSKQTCKKKREKNKTFKKFQSYQVGFLGNKKPEIGKVIFSIANNLSIRFCLMLINQF